MASLMFVRLLILGSILMASAFASSQLGLGSLLGEVDCTCSYHCPDYGIETGFCLDNENWFGPTVECCVPAFMNNALGWFEI